MHRDERTLESAESSLNLRVLLLSVTSPLPANNGVKMRTFSMLRSLAGDGHELTLLTFDSQETDSHFGELRQLCKRVITIPHRLESMSLSRNYLSRLKHLSSRLPFGVESVRSSQMKTEIDKLLGEDAFDIILSEQTDLVVNLPSAMSIPLIVDFHNAEYLILERYIRFERNLAKRLYARLECQKLKNWERYCCRRAAIGMACSEHDRRLLHSLNPELPILVVPNAIDVTAYSADSTEEPHTILFQGGMDWYPNRDAVEFFVHNIFHLVQRQIPGVKFVVAGRNPPEDFQNRITTANRNVEFTGTVADMRSQIAKAAVCVVPLRIGSGTRLKILESAAMAKSVVSTTIGAEGLEFRDGQEILLRDHPVEFATAIVELLRAPSRRRALGSAARARVEQTYSFECLQSSIRPVIGALVKGKIHRGVPPRSTDSLLARS